MITRFFSAFLALVVCACSQRKSKITINGNVFDSMSIEICNCITNNSAQTFALNDTCFGNAIKKNDAQLKDLNIDSKTVLGELKIASELHSRLLENCTYFVKKNQELTEISKEKRNRVFKYNGSFRFQEKLLTGDYMITLDSAGVSTVFISSDSINLKKLEGKENILIEYHKSVDENRVISIYYIK